MRLSFRRGFTLIELLVVFAITAILAAILFPVFAQAKVAAQRTVNLSNLRQVSLGVQMYATDGGAYPLMSSPSAQVPRTRWADHIYPYVGTEAVFTGPLAPAEVKTKRFAHNPAATYGGYGYNYQYLGNSRFPFSASESQIGAPSDTVAVADSHGVVKQGRVTAGEYVVDPPLPSDRGSGKQSGFYGDGAECDGGPQGCRSRPAERGQRRVTVAWADGHASGVPAPRLDDSDRNGEVDNGSWNGLADAGRR